jgi:hypothetical protein
MPNHYYIISEVQFFNDKEDENTWSFVAGSGIDLNQDCQSKMPTLQEIKIVLAGLGFDIAQQDYNDGYDNIVEVKATKGADIGLWLIFSNFSNETDLINMFEVGRGSDAELVIDFIKTLAKTHGKFLYYSDGGKMSLITKDKEKQFIMNEIY